MCSFAPLLFKDLLLLIILIILHKNYDRFYMFPLRIFILLVCFSLLVKRTIIDHTINRTCLIRFRKCKNCIYYSPSIFISFYIFLYILISINCFILLSVFCLFFLSFDNRSRQLHRKFLNKIYYYIRYTIRLFITLVEYFFIFSLFFVSLL